MNVKGSHVIHALHKSQRRRAETKRTILFLKYKRMFHGPTKTMGECLADKIKRREWVDDSEWHNANRLIRQHAAALADMANLGFYKLAR